MPRSGPYNLSQNINIYLWLRNNRIDKFVTFWALVNLVRENNSTDVMNAAHDFLPDVEGCDNEEKDSDSLDSTYKKIWLSLPILPYQLHQPGGHY